MIIYDGLKRDFMESVARDTLADTIQKNILEKMGHHTPEAEFNSWQNSLSRMYLVMNDPEIPEDAGIAIEYNIPQTAKRVDFMISGYSEQDKAGMVIVELKQWSKLKKVEKSDALVETVLGGSLRQVVHPSYQAWSYAQFISDYNAAVQDEKIGLYPCAYLHNYQRQENDPLDDSQYKEYTEEAPAFTKGQVEQLRYFIKKIIQRGDRKKILYEVDHGKVRPARSLQDAIASMLKGNKEFTLIDDQKVAYERVLKISRQCQKDYKKRTVICKGGPGTGKSVIAVRLMAELTREGQLVQYVSKNSAPRMVYCAKLKGDFKKTSVNNMFKGSGSYVDAPANSYPTLIVDEAHRLNAKSGMFHNLGENQIKEIIHSAMCSVFFIDETQRVTVNDIGSVDEIRKWADEEKSEIIEMELTSQFRCNGSDGYLSWLDNVLELRETANYDLDGVNYDIRVCDSPQQMQEMIYEKNKARNRARILAGYCWNWDKKGQNDPNYHDIKIGDFEISWNMHDGPAYAIDPNSINQAGCIHTTQGLEFDYVGVIIGNDMRYENGKVVTDFTKRARTDQSVKGLKKIYKEDPDHALKLADEIIKDTYKTLMTRGMKGCYIYCTDPGMQSYIKKRLAVMA